MTQLMLSLKKKQGVSGRPPNELMIFKYLLVLILHEAKVFLKIPKSSFPGSKNQSQHRVVTEILLTAIGWALVNLPTTRHQITSHARETIHVFFVLSFLDASGFQPSTWSGLQPGKPSLHL
jgi:hypothetical protein